MVLDPDPQSSASSSNSTLDVFKSRSSLDTDSTYIGSRRASAEPLPTLTTDENAIPRRKSSGPSLTSFSMLALKKSGLRSLFGLSSPTSPNGTIKERPAASSRPESVVSQTASVTSSHGSVSPMSSHAFDFNTADPSHLSAYYRKLTYSSATLQAVAVDCLECNAHASLFTFNKTPGALERRTFVLLPRAILRYALSATATSLPEQVLLISAESVAYASDDIPGHQYVLRVSERPERRQIEEQMSPITSQDEIASPTRSPTTPLSTHGRSAIFFHPNLSTPTFGHHHHNHQDQAATHVNGRGHHHHHHIQLRRDDKTKTMLLVFRTATEFMRWMDLVRSQIKFRRESDDAKGINSKDEYMLTDNDDSSFENSDRITRPLSTTTLSAMAMSTSQRPSVDSAASPSIAQRRSHIPTRPHDSSVSSTSVQTVSSFTSSASSVSSASLQQSLSSFSIRPQPARRESTTFSSLTRFTSLRRSSQMQDKPGTGESAIDDAEDDVVSVTSSVQSAKMTRHKRKVVRSPVGPPPQRPLPPIPTDAS